MARTNGTRNIKAEILTPATQPAEDKAAVTTLAVEPAADHSQEVDSNSGMSSGANMAEAGRAILERQLKKLRAAEPVAREGTDPEGVHDMRVATRRLRAALKVLEETVYDRRTTARLRRQLRELANALGETRDTDVFLEHLDTYDAELPVTDRTGLKPLREQLLARRDRARKSMLKTLDKPRTRKLLDKLERFVTTPGAGVADPANEPGEVYPQLVRHFAGSAVWRAYEEVLAYETELGPQTPVETLHRLRVAFKRLRYTIEFFEDGLAGETKPLLKQLVAAQDDLGALHDHQVAVDMAGQILQTHAGDASLTAYRLSRLAEIERLRQDFTEKKWPTVTGHDFKRRLALSFAEAGPDHIAHSQAIAGS